MSWDKTILNRLAALFIAVLSCMPALATDVRYLTYAGRIVDDAGNPLNGSVQFNIKITNAAGTCVLWEETLTDTLTAGVFGLQIGRGTNVFDGFGSGSIEGIFKQGLALNCKDATPTANITPLTTDDRNMTVSFNDGTGWQSMANQIPIRSVPYALYSANVGNLLGYPIAVTVAPTNGQVLQFQSGSNSWVPTTLAGGSGSVVGAGTAGAPGLSFTGDTNTGVFSPGADQVGISTNGVERVHVDATGNVGIGTTTPNSPFTVFDSVNSGSSRVTASFTNYYTNFAPTANMVGVQGIFQNGGNATVTTAYGLNGAVLNASSGNITNATGINSYVQTVGTGTVTNAYGLQSNITQTVGTITNAYGVYTGAIQGTNKWSIYTSDATAPSYFAGNVGIGTASPSSKLEVSGDIKLSNGANRVIGIADTTTSGVMANSITLSGGYNSGGGNAAGGAVLIKGGNAQGASYGGDVSITSGSSSNTAGSNPGSISISAGANISAGMAGGAASIRGGDNLTGPGGLVMVLGGDSVFTGNYNGGNVMISGGAPTGIGLRGDVIIASSGGNVGVGTASPTATLHLKSSSGAVGTAPLKLTAGTNLGTPEPGAIEFDGTSLYYTDSGNSRKTLSTGGSSFTGVTSISNSGGNITLAPVTTTGAVLINSGTPSVGSASGALVVTGGIGTSGDIYSAASVNAATTMSALTSILTPQLYGSASASGNIKIDGTSHATKGNVLLASAGGNVGIGNITPTAALHVVGSNGSAGAAPTALSVTGGIGAAGSAGGAIGLTSGDGNGTGNAGSINLTGGAAGAGASIAGGINLSGGASAGSGWGGAINIIGGKATAGGGSGIVTIRSGHYDNTVIPSGGAYLTLGASGSVTSASATLSSGDPHSNNPTSSGTLTLRTPSGIAGGSGGNISITAGNGDTGSLGGTVSISAGSGGSSNMNGSNVSIIGGAKGGSGTDGNVILASSRGNVGIATTTPLNSLDVGGGVALGSYAGGKTAPSNGLIVSGAVGIGTFGPGAALDVNAGTNAMGISSTNTLSGSATSAALTLTSTWNTTGNATLLFANLTNTASGASSKVVDIQVGGTSKFDILPNGNVGIGTATPTAKLDVNGNINLPTTTSSVGQLKINGSPVLHTYGSSNLYVGGAGNFTKTGSQNVGVGQFNMDLGVAGNNNTTLGFGAGHVLIGNDNTAIGNGALILTSTGIQNTGVGSGALSSNYLDNNTSVGFNSLASQGSASGNTALGSLAGYTSTSANANVSGNNNTYIGYDSGPGTSTQLSNATAIGYGARSTASNQVVIGNASVTAMVLNGNVGIGTTAPSTKLGAEVSDASTTQATAGWVANLSNADQTAGNWLGIAFSDAQSGPASATIQTKFTDHTNNYGELHLGTRGAGGWASRLVVDENGNVGIGATSPSATLDVKGHIANSGASATVGICGTSPSISGNDMRGTVTLGTGSPTACTITFAAAYATAPYCVVTASGGNPGAVQWWVTSSTTTLVMNFSATPTASQQFVYYCIQ